MAINRADITVGDVGELALVHVAELKDGANAWVVAELDYFVLQKNSGAAPSADVVQPISGSPSAGAANARWVRLGSGVPIVGRTFEARLTSDAIIVTSPPTPPFTFPPGQPAVLLALPFVSRGGPLAVSASFGVEVGVQLGFTGTEGQPAAQMSLWLDGVQVPDIQTTVGWGATTLPNATQLIAYGGSIATVLAVTAAPHTLELRWATNGQVPRTFAICFAASGLDHASLVATEVTP